MKKVYTFMDSDLIFDFLSWIPVKDLVGWKWICREWNLLISSRSFIKAQMENTEHVLTGFIYQEQFVISKADIKIVSYIPVETRGAKVFHFVFNFLPENVVILASCNGLVCCGSCFPFRDSAPSLYVCNPSIQEWIVVKWPSSVRIGKNIAPAFDPSKDSVDTSTKFKLVNVLKAVVRDYEWYFAFDIYSSETRKWRRSCEICQCDGHLNLIKNKGIYIEGVLHWLTDGDKVLTFDVEKERFRLISIPIAVWIPTSISECIGEYEGKLHCVLVSEAGLHVWYLQDYDEIKWTIKHCKSLEEIDGDHMHCEFRSSREQA